ncbi:MAG: hypothetical protein RL347_1156 [Actinomycetota bacterium]
MQRMTSRFRLLPIALAPLLAVGALANSAAASSEYVDAVVGESPTGVAVSDDGVIAAGLFDAKAVALVKPDGTVRRASIGCSPSDVAISPDGATAWAVCQESEHLSVVDIASLGVSQASMGVVGLDAIDYLPEVDELVIGSLQGTVLAVREVATGGYSIYMSTNIQDVTPGVGVTQLAPLSDGSGAYAITDGGDLIFVDLEFGGQVALIADGSPRRFFNSIAMGPFDTALYAAVMDYDTADIKNTVEIVDMATGASRQSVLLDAVTPGSTTIELTAGNRAVYAAFGLYVTTSTGATGLLTVAVDDGGRLAGVQGADAPAAAGSAAALSADGSRVVFGTTNAGAVGLSVDGDPYPAAIRLAAKATGSKLRITGTTTSMRPLTALTVYVKDLTKKKTRFVKQAKPALLNYQGDITWSGKAPSKRFALYLSGGGAKSTTVTVTVR